MKILSLFGISGAGKTTLFNRLRVSLNQSGFDSTLAISSFYTQNMVNKINVSDKKIAYIRLLDQICEILASFSRLEQSCNSGREIIVLFETFLFNAIFEHNLSNNFYQAYDDFFKRFNPKFVYLHIPNNMIMEQSIRSTKKYRGAKWCAYIDNMGDSENDVAQLFIQQQQVFENIVEGSENLDILKINTSVLQWDQYERQIIDFVKK